jgi:hypothetical protein
MRYDDKNKRRHLRERLEAPVADTVDEGHIVFDFTGMEQANVGDLALILTARLGTAPDDTVWVRSIPWHTAEVLRMLRVDHLFPVYPEDEGQPN